MDFSEKVFSSERITHAAEVLSRALRGLLAGGEYGPPEAYFLPGEPRPGDPAFFDAFDRINDHFVEYLDPGEVSAPRSEDVTCDGTFASFPSALPSGDADLDRVVLKLYPPPPDPPPVGVLFHPWFGLSGWLGVDYLLRPLARHLRVAAMTAPHHLSRCREGFYSGEGFVNPNPRHIFEGFRQWQADHLAALDLLRRDFGFEAVVVVGYSLGGYGALLNRLIRPPMPTVAICTTNHYARGLFGGMPPFDLVRRLREAGFTYESFHHATRSLHLARWATAIGGEDLTWIYAHYDTIEPPESLREAREAVAPERLVEIEGGHSTAILDQERIVREVFRRVVLTNRRCGGGSRTPPSPAGDGSPPSLPGS